MRTVPQSAVDATRANVFLDVIERYCVSAKVISSDETRDYEVLVILNSDGYFMRSCRCKGWRLGGDDCKHILAVLSEWIEERQKRGWV